MMQSRLQSPAALAHADEQGPPPPLAKFCSSSVPGREGQIMARSKAYARNATAQKERVDTQQVTKSQSLTLVKNLVRVSISTVCHIRNIFPRSCFQERTYAGMRIYQLDPSPRQNQSKESLVSIQQAYMLTQWLERGVFEAIERRFLRRMELIVVSPERRLPRESYSFDLEYAESEDDPNITFSGTRVTTVDNARGQMVKLIRSLIQFSNTLDEIPSERIINMKLWYYDERTPPNWEPKYFSAADPSELSFNREGDHDTLRIRIGELCTPHHNLKVRFEGVEPSLERDEDDEAMGDGDKEHRNEAERRSKEAGLIRCEARQTEEEEEGEEDEDGDDDDDDMPDQGREQRNPPATTPQAPDVSKATSVMSGLSVSSRKNDDDPHRESSISERGVTSDVRVWISKQAKPSISGLKTKFRFSKEEAKECLAQLVDEHVLHKDARGRYSHVTSSSSPGAREEKREQHPHEDQSDHDVDDDAGSTVSQMSTMSDDSATQDPRDVKTINKEDASMMPPPPPRRREEGATRAAPPEPADDADDVVTYSTPPVASGSMPDLQPVPEKPRQEVRIISTGTKRALDEGALSENDEMRDDEPVDIFTAPAATIGSAASTTAYEVSLSQASSIAQTAKCSLVKKPIRQSAIRKRSKLSGVGAGVGDKGHMTVRQ